MAKDESPQEKELRKIAERVETNISTALRDLMAKREGRDFLWWLLQIGKWGIQPFAADPHVTAFSCGELNVGQQVLAKILEVDPTGFMKMQEDQRNAARERSAAAPDGTDDSTGAE